MRRRWLQFSLRGFLLAMTAFAIWLGLVAEKAMRQKETVALFEEWGAKVDYAYRWQGPDEPPKKASPPGWSWLRKALGPHFFDEVVSLDLVGGSRPFTSADLAALRSKDATAPPASLLVLTDRDLIALSHLPDLRWLKIVGDMNLTESGLRRLGRLGKLETLIFVDTSGRSTGGMTDATLTAIELMPQLTSLHLEGHHITDAGLANIHWPAGLTELNLSGTRITDQGLEHLKKISTLQRLVILDTQVTYEGVVELHRALPNCDIYRHHWDGL
jgi:hypothetical protein